MSQKRRSAQTAKLSYSVSEAMAATGLGKNRLYEEIRTGRLAGKRIGGRVVVLASALQDWLNRAPSAARAA